MDEPWRHYAEWKNQSQKDKHCTTPLKWGPQSSQIHTDRKLEKRLPGNGELVFNEDGVSVLQDERSSGDGWWWWLQKMNVLSDTELNLHWLKR